MMNLYNKVEKGERLSSKENIAWRLMQEATVHTCVDYNFPKEEVLNFLDLKAAACFENKDFVSGSAVKKAYTNVELATLWLDYKIDEENEKVKELMPTLEALKAIPREKSSRKISLAIAAIEEAMLWLSSK